LQDSSKQNEQERSGIDSTTRQLDLAFASPVMHAGLCEVRKLTATLSEIGDAMLIKQVLALLNVVNEQLYGMLEGQNIE